jgi:hypothetical protein
MLLLPVIFHGSKKQIISQRNPDMGETKLLTASNSVLQFPENNLHS